MRLDACSNDALSHAVLQAYPVRPENHVPRSEIAMSLRPVRTIEIPGSDGSAFDHGAFEPKTGRVFVAHTARHHLDVIDHGTFRHITTLDGFPGAAGNLWGIVSTKPDQSM